MPSVPSDDFMATEISVAAAPASEDAELVAQLHKLAGWLGVKRHLSGRNICVKAAARLEASGRESEQRARERDKWFGLAFYEMPEPMDKQPGITWKARAEALARDIQRGQDLIDKWHTKAAEEHARAEALDRNAESTEKLALIYAERLGAAEAELAKARAALEGEHFVHNLAQHIGLDRRALSRWKLTDAEAQEVATVARDALLATLSRSAPSKEPKS